MKILKLTPAIKDYIWGGTRLSKEFDMVSFTDRQAEAWVLSCHEAGHSIVENGEDKGRTLAEVIAERTRSQVVHVIGKKIVLYKPDKKNKSK